jgi:hypothetical protein
LAPAASTIPAAIGSDIAGEAQRAAHDQQPPGAPQDARRQALGQGQVGQRRSRHQLDGVRRMLQQQFDQAVGRMPVLHRRGGADIDATQAVFAMHQIAPGLGITQRQRCAGVHRHLALPGQIHYFPAVDRRGGHRPVAGHGGHRQHPQRRAAGRQQQRQGIVDPRIAVDNDVLHVDTPCC